MPDNVFEYGTHMTKVMTNRLRAKLGREVSEHSNYINVQCVFASYFLHYFATFPSWTRPKEPILVHFTFVLVPLVIVAAFTPTF